MSLLYERAKAKGETAFKEPIREKQQKKAREKKAIWGVFCWRGGTSKHKALVYRGLNFSFLIKSNIKNIYICRLFRVNK